MPFLRARSRIARKLRSRRGVDCDGGPRRTRPSEKSALSDWSVSLEDTQLTHSQFIDVQCPKTSLLDRQPANRDASNRQCTNCNRAERRRAQRKRQQAGYRSGVGLLDHLAWAL